MKRDDCFKCRKYIAAKKRVCSIFDKFRARALQHPQIQTPCVYRMEFHLLNEREIKTIRPRVHQLAKPLASSRARARHSLIFTLGILDPETTFDSNVSFNFFARFFLFLRYLTFLFLHAASSSAPPPSPSPNLGSFHRLSFSLSRFLSLPLSFCRLKEGERENHLPSSSHPILSRRRHFAPFIDPAPTHSPAFPATFLPPNESACTSYSLCLDFSVFFIGEISNPFPDCRRLALSDSLKSLPFAN